MSERDPDAINRLIGEFIDLHEAWERGADTFDWKRLESLAREGAHAYNEAAGPSFHALALDGVLHDAFHERFLEYSLHAGFDPFKLVQPGNDAAAIPVIDHDDLAEAALSNASSARMHDRLLALAHERFEPLVAALRDGGELAPEMFKNIEACAESIPPELLRQLAPQLLSRHIAPRRQRTDQAEGYLSTAEARVENSRRPHG